MLTDWGLNHGPVSKLINEYMVTKGRGSAGVLKTVTGNPISVTDALAAKIKSLTVECEPIQSGSGDPSPDNVRPISGRDSVEVEAAGINIWDEEWESGGINAVGELVTDATRIRSKNYIRLFSGESYYVSTALASTDLRMAFYDAEKAFVSNSSWLKTGSITVTANVQYAKFVVANSTTYNHDISINYPSTDHYYHAYRGQTVTIQLGQTVYGGTIDMTAGTVTVDRVMRLLNDPDKWSATTGTINYQYDVSFSDRKIHQNSFEGLISSYMPVVNSSTAKTMRWTSASSLICGIKDADLTLEQIKSDASAGKIAICYELAEPLTVQLTPQTLALLKGSNTLWTDGDALTLTYKAEST